MWRRAREFEALTRKPPLRSRFPGQEHTAGSPKVPSILYYDKEGVVRAAGAEVNIAENVEKAEDEEWVKAEW